MAEYEFSQDENQVVGDLSNKMGCVGAFMLLMGVLYICAAGFVFLMFSLAGALTPPQSEGSPAIFHLLGIVFLAVFGVAAAILLGTGVWMRRASGSFGEIVKTEGHDIGSLMNALRELKKLYSLWGTMLGLGAAFMLVGLFIELSLGGH